ncbi:MAG: hypothetical protein WB523_02425 [Candidatus Sulfotelmatobacter sp.]
MNKAGRTRDELIKHFSQTGAPEGNDFPSAASGPYQTKAANAPTGEETFPFPGRDVEYRPSASSLPMSVSAAQVKRDNCDRGNMPWDSETENAPILAGTRSGTPSATPISDELGENIASGNVRGVAQGAGETISKVGSVAGGIVGGALGELAAGPVGALAGGGLGSSIGAVPGEAIKSLAEAGEE